jgi:hypothetical protein
MIVVKFSFSIPVVYFSLLFGFLPKSKVSVHYQTPSNAVILLLSVFRKKEKEEERLPCHSISLSSHTELLYINLFSTRLQEGKTSREKEVGRRLKLKLISGRILFSFRVLSSFSHAVVLCSFPFVESFTFFALSVLCFRFCRSPRFSSPSP